MDADVVANETSRSDTELPGAFDKIRYPNIIGTGVCDIHLSNILTQDHSCIGRRA